MAQTIPGKPSTEGHAESGSYTVQKGDSLASIARKTGTNATALAKLNKIKNPAMIRIGQVIKLPGKSTKPAATPAKEEKTTVKTETKQESTTAHASKTTATSNKEYTIQSGDTLYSIARKQGVALATLKKANPSVDPSNLKIGQTLKLQGGSSATQETVAKTVPAEPEKPATKPVPKQAEPEKVAETKETKEPVKPTAPVATATHETKAKPPEEQAPPVKEPAKHTTSSAPKVVSVTIDQEITFGEFAAQHNISPEELIALNGFKASELPVGTVLAKGSELYIPAKDQ